MKTGILVALAALAVVGLGVGVVAVQAVTAPHATASGTQGGCGSGMMGGSYGGGMMGGSYGGGMMGGQYSGGMTGGGYGSCQQYMADHNYTWDPNTSYGPGGMMD